MLKKFLGELNLIRKQSKKKEFTVDINEMQSLLQTKLKPQRYAHCIGVMNTAVELAKRFNVDEKKAALAGLLHDCAREFETSQLLAEAQKRHLYITDIDRQLPILMHAPLGTAIAKEEYGVHDTAILKAIASHTVGGANMSNLDKIIYLADMIEPHRKYDEVDKLRQLAATKDLDTVMISAFDQSITFIMRKGHTIHPYTVAARNEILLNREL